MYLCVKKRILSKSNEIFSIVMEIHNNMVDLYNVNHQLNSSLIVNIVLLTQKHIPMLTRYFQHTH